MIQKSPVAGYPVVPGPLVRPVLGRFITQRYRRFASFPRVFEWRRHRETNTWTNSRLVPSATEGWHARDIDVRAGAICREVRDLKLSMSAMSQGDPRDPWWAPTPLFGWPQEPGPIKVAVTKEDYGWDIHPVAETADRAAAILSDAGYAVEEVETPSMQAPAQCWIDVFVHEMNATLGSAAREMGSEEIVRSSITTRAWEAS